MALDPTAVRRDDDLGWDFTWPVGSAPYEVWLDGFLLASGLTVEAYTYSDIDYTDVPPPIEIVETGAVAENYTFPPYMQLQWRGLQVADGYLIERWDGAAWNEVDDVLETGRGYYQWTSPRLADAQTHKYRVTAVTLEGGEGTPVEFEMFMVSNPAPPDAAYSVNTAGDIVVS